MDKGYDLICIGSGTAGYTAAIRASQLGKHTAIVERSIEKVGGTCLNEGCIPVKGLIRSSQIYSDSLLSQRNKGISASGKKNIKDIMAGTALAVSRLKKGLLYLFKKNNIDLIEGDAELAGANEVLIKMPDGRREYLATQYIILAAGSHTWQIPGFKIDGKRIISSTDALNLEKIPNTITIIGGGAIGVEFAYIFNNLGSKVTIIEAMEHILPHADKDISTGLDRVLRRKGVEIITGRRVKLDEVKTDVILTAVGRVPNTKGLGLENAGVNVDKGIASTGNWVKADRMMRTSQKNIFATGDMIKTPMFAHTASEEAVIASEYICGLDPEPINYQNIPMIVYGNVETASIGITEQEAKENGYDIKTAKQYFKSNSRSVINGHTDGFVKIIADKETQAFLGVHILGDGAAEIIHPFIVAKSAGLSVEDMGKIVFGHPTVSEIIKDACKSVFGRPINS